MEDNNLHEVYIDVKLAIDYAFQNKFVLKFYDYLKIKNIKKYEVEQFIESSVANELSELVMDLEEYIKGGNDNDHKQLREDTDTFLNHRQGRLKITCTQY